MKICSKCQRELDEERDFYKDSRGGWRAHCKRCHGERSVEYYKTHKDACDARVARWGRENKDSKSARIARWREKNVRRVLFTHRRQQARLHGTPFEIEFEDIVWPDLCPVFGFPLRYTLRGKMGGGFDSPSIDQIKPGAGYVKGNVAVISWRANRLKGDGSLEELESLCKWLRSTRDQLPARYV